MKRRSTAAVLALSALLLAGCSAGAATEAPAPASPSPAVTAAPTETATPAPTAAPAAAEAPNTAADGPVDIDLTAMSGTMVYSEVYNMIRSPDWYMGKTVKMTGSFSVYETESARYFSCVVADATACCAQGLEFELKDGYSYPEDYPEQGSTITVVGTFSSYTEEYGGNTYLYLRLVDAELL